MEMKERALSRLCSHSYDLDETQKSGLPIIEPLFPELVIQLIENKPGSRVIVAGSEVTLTIARPNLVAISHRDFDIFTIN